MRLILENIGIIEKADINISGLTIIAGNNDSGKSTIGKIAYSLTKSFEDFESNYEKSKTRKIQRYSLDLFRLFRENLDLRKMSELRELMDRLRMIKKIDNKRLLDLIDRLKRSIDKNSIKIDEKTRKKIDDYSNKIEAIFTETKSKNSKIIQSVKDIFESEFRNQINNILTNESKISVLDGKNSIINIQVRDNEIVHNKSEKIDEIFPFDSSVFIETPFILTYKEELEMSKIHHVRELLNKLETPNINNKNGSLNISKIIKGEIYFDEEEDNFSFKKISGKKKIKIDILNSASGIKSLGILQLLDRSEEFNKNLLLIIDEPEVHLHPDWQVEYAKLLVQLVKQGVKVLITSHSPYLIEALNKFSKEEKLGEDVKFYLSESNKDGKAIIIDKTKDKEEIFDKLSKPFERLVFGE